MDILTFTPRKTQAKVSKKFPPTQMRKPTIGQQQHRLAPKFKALQNAFQRQNMEIQKEVDGIDPERVLVFEVAGSVDTFIKATRKIKGFEWLGELEGGECDPDENFAMIAQDKNEKKYSEKFYFVMSNHRALLQLLSLWNIFCDNKEFDWGLKPFRELFEQLKDIRLWNENDRIGEFGVRDKLEELVTTNIVSVKVQIELWFSSSEEKRLNRERQIRFLTEQTGGRVICSYQNIEIRYHAIIIECSTRTVREMLDGTSPLIKATEIQWIRPTGQVIDRHFGEGDSVVQETVQFDEAVEKSETPIIALLDGMPMENHILLQNHLLVDDPDNWADDYIVKNRKHGTAMASLLIHGDISAAWMPLSSKLYVRPIFRLNAEGEECVPNDVIFVDLLHRAVKRIMENEEFRSVKIINLSVGDSSRLFLRSTSPEARMLDWLSYHYKVLFVISAGNHVTDLFLTGSYRDFKNKTKKSQMAMVYQYLQNDKRNRTLLAPAESINGITVGALHADMSVVDATDKRIDVTDSSMPATYTALGGGYGKSIKPDLVYNGGKLTYQEIFIDSSDATFRVSTMPAKTPGQKVASPFNPTSTVYVRGTSNATAIVSRLASDFIKVINQIPHLNLPDELMAIAIKAMLVHSCSWGEIGEKLEESLELKGSLKKQIISNWIGYGMPDVERVKECTQQRVTLMGYGSISQGQEVMFNYPLPSCLNSIACKKKLTITLAWFSPINSGNKIYRKARLAFTQKNHNIADQRLDVYYHSVKRGTVQHEILIGEKAIPFLDNDNIEIIVSCSKEEGLTESIPYVLLATLEVAPEEMLPLYDEIKAKVEIQTQVPIMQ